MGHSTELVEIEGRTFFRKYAQQLFEKFVIHFMVLRDKENSIGQRVG